MPECLLRKAAVSIFDLAANCVFLGNFTPVLMNGELSTHRPAYMTGQYVNFLLFGRLALLFLKQPSGNFTGHHFPVVNLPIFINEFQKLFFKTHNQLLLVFSVVKNCPVNLPQPSVSAVTVTKSRTFTSSSRLNSQPISCRC